jgi:hypothetical protein
MCNTTKNIRICRKITDRKDNTDSLKAPPAKAVGGV